MSQRIRYLKMKLVKVLKLQINNLSMNNKFSEIIQDIPSVKLPKVVKASSNIPATLKFKPNMCDSSIKKRSHKRNTRIPSIVHLTKKLEKDNLGLHLM